MEQIKLHEISYPNFAYSPSLKLTHSLPPCLVGWAHLALQTVAHCFHRAPARPTNPRPGYERTRLARSHRMARLELFRRIHTRCRVHYIYMCVCVVHFTRKDPRCFIRVRSWHTQAGAAELRREVDRIRGAGGAISLTLRAWEAGATTSAAASRSPSSLRRRREEA